MNQKRFESVRAFLFAGRRPEEPGRLPAVSLFSGAGLSDIGYEIAGFQFAVHAEQDTNRAALCSTNHKGSTVVSGRLRDTSGDVIHAYRELHPTAPPALVTVTPPCQGMSSSNPRRGARMNGDTRDARNKLLLDALPVVKALSPRVVVIENIPAILTEPHVEADCGHGLSVVEGFAQELPEYILMGRVVQIANYGVAQDRRRAVLVAIHHQEPWLCTLLDSHVGPWPVPTHDREPEDGKLPWVTLEEWLDSMDYSRLDAKSEQTACDPSDMLHQVPHYEGDYYWRVADIPPRSGRSAYQNCECRECGRTDVPEGTATCPYCGSIMRNRPYVVEDDGNVRLVKGRKHSSYRRMRPDQPARTITTASSHVGSDYKIHPWENRVLSIRECADLQTVPRLYDWSWALETRHIYLMRQVIGEALPPWFTYLQGRILRRLLNGEEPVVEEFASPRVLLASTR